MKSLNDAARHLSVPSCDTFLAGSEYLLHQEAAEHYGVSSASRSC